MHLREGFKKIKQKYGLFPNWGGGVNPKSILLNFEFFFFFFINDKNKLVWYNTNNFFLKSKIESILLIGGGGVTGGLEKVHTFIF